MSAFSYHFSSLFPSPEINLSFSSKVRPTISGYDKTYEEVWRTYRPKRCEYKDGDEGNGPNILSDKTKWLMLKRLLVLAIRETIKKIE